MGTFLNSILFTPKSRFDVAVMAAILSFAIAVTAKFYTAPWADIVIDCCFLFCFGPGVFAPPLSAAFFTAKFSGPALNFLLDRFFTAGTKLVLSDIFFHIEHHSLRVTRQSVALAVSFDAVSGPSQHCGNGLIANSFKPEVLNLFFFGFCQSLTLLSVRCAWEGQQKNAFKRRL
jgi:hypothetical protein